jgi:hypothetical protein
VALEEHSGNHVVPAVEVREQFVQQITMFWTLPEVMMRINNREVRIEDRFRQRLRQPRIIRWMDSPESGGLSWLCHAMPPTLSCRAAG